ncbi:MAG: hypothetical protein GC134_04275 [Proteobacteria bacterium]|nr:hypothetical protein [Pseudomonadota bacterium]
MTLTGSLKNDFFAAVAAIGALGVFLGLGGIFMAIQLPVFIMVLLASFTRNSGNRLIPGNIEFAGLTFIAGTYTIQMAALVGTMLAGTLGAVFGILAGFAVAFVILMFAEVIGGVFIGLVQQIVASLGLAPQYAMLVFILLFFGAFFLLGAISPVLSTAVGLALWGWWALQRGNQLTGWNDTAN